MLTMDKKIKDFDTFVFDLDGTLYNSQKVISENTRNTIKQLHKLNKNVIIATGRPYYMNYKIIEDLNIKLPIIAGNGSMIYDVITKQVLFFKSIEKKSAKNIVDYLENNKIDYLGYSKFEMIGNNYSNPDWFAKIIYPHLKKDNLYKWKYEEKEINNFVDEYDFSKFLIITQNISDEKIKELIDFLNTLKNDIYYVSSAKGVIDIMSKNISKGDALLKLMNLKNITNDKSISFGDAANDIPMLKTTSFSVAMGNAINEVKETASFVTKTNDEDGVSYFINLLEGKNEC